MSILLLAGTVEDMLRMCEILRSTQHWSKRGLSSNVEQSTSEAVWRSGSVCGQFSWPEVTASSQSVFFFLRLKHLLHGPIASSNTVPLFGYVIRPEEVVALDRYVDMTLIASIYVSGRPIRGDEACSLWVEAPQTARETVDETWWY